MRPKNGQVLIRHIAGTLHSVSLEPPVVGAIAVCNFPNFEGALGYAIGEALGRGMGLVDETKRLTSLQLLELMAATWADQLERDPYGYAEALDTLASDAT